MIAIFNYSIGQIAQLAAIAIMVIGVASIPLSSRLTKDGMRRVIQFLGVILVIPTIIILALEKVLSAETTGTLIGAVTGYLLSGLGSETPWKGQGEPQRNSHSAADKHS